MTHEDAKLYIEEVSRTGSILGLESIQNLMKELDNVQDRLQIIHIGGTNGKGSTGAFMEAVLIEAGYKVGRYTSPAVFEAFEVWRINRKNIDLVDYLACLEEVKNACERMLKKGMAQPTVFEVETALAFVYFYKTKCDYVLLEVGMGGETDATNLITKPVCSVLTSISMDHLQFLGNSLEEIAKVKAGIVKEGCPLVTSSLQKSEVLQVLKEACAKKQAKLFLSDMNLVKAVKETLSGSTYQQEELGTIELQISGSYQIENSNLALTVCKEILKLPEKIIKEGLKKAYWPGRFEVVSENPLVILDGAHNEDAAEKLAQTLQKHFTKRRITYIIGVLADKEHEKILECLLPLAESVYTVTPPSIRALDGSVLAQEAESFGKRAVFCETIEKAAELALEEVKSAKTDALVAFGSLSYLSALKAELYKDRG